MVRVTISRWCPGSSRSALGVSARRNSAYASSTTTIPGATASTASITSGDSAVPVGLLGEVRKTMSGRLSSTMRTARPASRWKSSSRAPRTHPVPVTEVMTGCME
jgi:hypothetical protein